jgi:hypothetical protein
MMTQLSSKVPLYLQHLNVFYTGEQCARPLISLSYNQWLHLRPMGLAPTGYIIDYINLSGGP